MINSALKPDKTSHKFLPSNEELDAFRQVGDQEADAIIEELMEVGKKEELYKVFKARTFKDIALLKITNEKLRSFLESNNQLPEWVNSSQMKIAGELFRKRANDFLFVLGTVSLPYCYAGAKGATALYHTEKIRKNTELRLLDTTYFVVEIMGENAFNDSGDGFLLVKQVRLRHALARYFLKKIPAIQELEETPVNQEDMAGTNLAFSYILLQAMGKIGVKLSLTEKEAYLHFWKVMGYLLGIKLSLLPSSLKGAFWLEKQIAMRQFYPSLEGKSLTKQLISHYKNTIPNTGTKILMQPLIAYLNGKEVSDVIGISDSNRNSTLQKIMVLLPLFRKYIFPPAQPYSTIKNQILNRMELINKI
ncbi:oxygenase MpaB family protein [Flexithrix dorotheae]|uniref:oxygenase MpaB family protein n=1 Tax=Flexithrix dorotheae TaxID=70993 RepID=UPI0003787AAA|nr:oxygenase MpaB family protein [Flexithrix dorotheae]